MISIILISWPSPLEFVETVNVVPISEVMVLVDPYIIVRFCF